MKPSVSVIVTVYNRLDFLLEALASAMNQTFAAREIIVADDSGSAAARDICEPLVASGQIRYRANPRTLGAAGSVRGAIADAQGDFISILNDDDLWEPNFLSQVVPPLQRDSERVLCFSDHWIISGNGSIDYQETEANTRRYGRLGLREGDVSNLEDFVLVRKGVPLAMASVFRRDVIDPSLLTDELSSWYDFWIECILVRSGGKFYYVPQRLTRYRVHLRSETARRSPERFENQIYIFSQLLRRNWFPKMNGFFRSTLAGAFFMLGRDKLYFNQAREARRCFLQSIETERNWRSMVAIVLTHLPRFFRTWLGLSHAAENDDAGGD